ncbi:hypothetical protein HD806DRAFT_505944 [Xylariaceae sp. AK1471]|nr:hypothetical protein HD806DRAFT_505944 [Xylariaceae sp. AK1471]
MPGKLHHQFDQRTTSRNYTLYLDFKSFCKTFCFSYTVVASSSSTVCAMSTQNESNPSYLDDIPPLTSIAPAIFVPIDRDLTKTPPPLPDDPVARLEYKLAEFDRYAAKVEENIILMLEREAERVRRAGLVDHRPIKNRQEDTVPDLTLEERILKEDEAAVLKMLGDPEYQGYGDASGSREEPRADRWHRNRPHSPPAPSPRPRGPGDPEYADLTTLRSQMFRVDPGEARDPPRTVALTHMLNLVQWGWEDQIEGHRAAVKKYKEEQRAALRREMAANLSPLATTGPSASAPPAPRPPTPGLPHHHLADSDAMDLDG